jgi:hypothetical protein
MPAIEERPGIPPRSTSVYEESNGTAAPTLVTAGAAAHTKGSWTELISSTSKKTVGIMVFVTAQGTGKKFLCDIGVGAVDSEVVLIPNLITYVPSFGSQGNQIFIPVVIPAGSRITARCQCDSAGSFKIYVRVSLMEVD